MTPRPLAFVDLETTGANGTVDRITEIGIVTVDPDGTTKEWQQLVNPGVGISAFIEQLTGISNAMVADAPAFSSVAQEVLRHLEGRLFIAHNARFDYGFLKNEFKRLGIGFRANVLCTVKLSRALFPEHKRHALDALIERHGLIANGRHRALADAQLIHQFWGKIQQQPGPEAVAAALKAINAYPTLPPQLDPRFVDDLPEAPGVYLFYGAAPEKGSALPLYIGKAKDLRKRVLSHFAADIRSAKERALGQQVQRIEWIETAGEIEALLKEAALVKTLQPDHNRQLRKNGEVCTWTVVDAGDGWLRPQLLKTCDLAFDIHTACYGLFKHAKEANDVLRALAESNHLCTTLLGLDKGQTGKPCFGYQLKRCKGACVGHETAAKHSVRLISALSRLKLHSWPFKGPAILREGEALHLIEGWRYLGTAHRDEDLHTLLADGRPQFDRDTYRILSKYLSKMQPLVLGPN